MDRKEYLERLEELLLVLPREEREEALQYYTDYFDDAGVENENQVIRELGSPEEVAAKIRAGFAGEYGEYSEQGFEDTRFQDNQEIIAEPKEYRRNINIWKVIAIALIVLLLSPVILPIGIGGIAIVFGIVVAVIAIIFALGVSGFAVLFAGVAIIVAGLAKVLMTPAIGILAAGIGCILLAIGILLSWLIITVVVKVVPGIIRGIVKVVGTPFRKAGAR